MQFNPNDYEMVEARIARLYSMHDDARIVTEECTEPVDREKGIWVVKASIFLSAGDQANNLVKATGYAFEIAGGAGANRQSALENCETSAIGRALANMGLHGNKRASREEMAKVARGVAEPVGKPVQVEDTIDWAIKYAHVKTVDEAGALYQEATAAGAPDDVIKSIETLGLKLGKK